MHKVITIHQPQYLPWIPYFEKILRADTFVLLDNVAFQKNGVQNRNQIKTPNGLTYLTVPVKQQLGQLICDVVIADQNAVKKHLKSIRQHYAKAPFFEDFMPLLEDALTLRSDRLVDLAVHTIEACLQYLGYGGDVIKASDINCDGRNSELICNICLTLQAKTYLSGRGGRNYLDLKDFAQHGIDVIFQEFDVLTYGQLYPKLAFMPDVSMIDMLFCVGPAAKQIILEQNG